MGIFRHADLALLAALLVLFLVAGLPLLGWGVGAACYVGQKVIAHLLERRAQAATDTRTSVGLIAGSMIARGWIVALVIFGAGLAAGDDVGLSAALVFLAAFTVALTFSLILRPLERQPGR